MKRANRLMLVAGVVPAAIAFVAVLAFANFTSTPTTGITLKELIDHWGVLPPKPVAP